MTFNVIYDIIKAECISYIKIEEGINLRDLLVFVKNDLCQTREDYNHIRDTWLAVKDYAKKHEVRPRLILFVGGNHELLDLVPSDLIDCYVTDTRKIQANWDGCIAVDLHDCVLLTWELIFEKLIPDILGRLQYDIDYATAVINDDLLFDKDVFFCFMGIEN